MPAIQRFLVIDDDPLCNIITKHLILQLNPEADIKIFTEPETALSFIQAEVPMGGEASETILLLDINMPFMSGWEFLEEFNSLSFGTQVQYNIYIVTSSIEENDKEQADNHPLVLGFLSKPLFIDSIRNIVKI